MLVYTRARFKPKKKRKVRGVIATKYDAKKYMDSKSVYAPRDRRPPRAESEVVMQAKSLVTTACFTARQSMTDAASLAKEPQHVQDEIIAIAYNKGAYQYVTDETDPKTIGSGERLRRGG
jgi:hypothetical protein